MEKLGEDFRRKKAEISEIGQAPVTAKSQLEEYPVSSLISSGLATLHGKRIVNH